MRAFFFALFAFLAFASSPAHATACNPPSGFLTQSGTINIGDFLSYGPQCGQVQDGSSGGLPSLINPNNWLGDQHFCSGVPWIDVKCPAYGALGNGSADDTAAINAAFAAASAGEWIYFPFGKYCVKSGSGAVATTQGLNIFGNLGTALDSCSSFVTPLTINADHIQLWGLSINGPQFGAVNNENGVNVGSACTRCFIHDGYITGGYYNISVAAPDVTVTHEIFGGAYGAALVHVFGTGAGAYWDRNEIDQNWPISVPTTYSTFPARANTTVYSIGNVVSYNGFLIQASAGGTSGGAGPTLQNYGTPISDGSVTWQLVGPTTFAGALVDTGASNNLFFQDDITGPYTYGVEIGNSGSGVVPSGTIIRDGTIGEFTSIGIYAPTGNGLYVHGEQIANCSLAPGGCDGIYITSAFGSTVAVDDGNIIYGMGSSGAGVLLGASADAIISGNQLFPGGTAISVLAGVSHFNILGNFGGTSNFGTNANCIQVAAGSSNFYNIVGNDCNGASSTGITDGGTGSSKLTWPNNGPIPGQFPATGTNDNAATGLLGEYQTSSVAEGSAVALTNNTAANITSLSLTAGDWDVNSTVCIDPAGTTTMSFLAGWLSSTSATFPFPGPDTGGYFMLTVTFSVGQVQCLPTGTQRFSLSATTSVYLSVYATFATSTSSAYGTLRARRVR